MDPLDAERIPQSEIEEPKMDDARHPERSRLLSFVQNDCASYRFAASRPDFQPAVRSMTHAELEHGFRSARCTTCGSFGSANMFHMLPIQVNGGNPVFPFTLRSAANDPARPAPRGGLAPSVLRRVREYIEVHLSGRIEIDELAALAGLSGCHFSRAFKQSTGVPPHRYLMQYRVDVAAVLLRDTDTPIADLSLAVGFADQSHFSRIFGQTMGETPRAFRKRHR